MKSIKFLLIALIILIAYDSKLPYKFGELDAKDWIVYVLFYITFLYGISLNTNKK